jgi:hypothetical protein
LTPKKGGSHPLNVFSTDERKSAIIDPNWQPGKLQAIGNSCQIALFHFNAILLGLQPPTSGVSSLQSNNRVCFSAPVFDFSTFSSLTGDLA